MKRLTFLVIIPFLGMSIHLHAQSKFWKTNDAYLGQKPPGDKPRIFAHDLLEKADTFSMDRSAFSQDGKEFYYCTNTTWYNLTNAKTKYFKYENGKWRGPFLLMEHYFAPTFSVDDTALYLEGANEAAATLIWQSHRSAGGWTQPTVYLRKGYDLSDFIPTKSGTCYVGSNGTQGKLFDYNSYDICELKMSAEDTVIKSLGTPLNTPGFDGDFFIDGDESYIIISTNETSTYECELYISFHKPDKTWTKPVSLGPLINDGSAHRWGQYVSPDGKYLFYSRGTSPKDCHVYWVRFDRLLAKLRKGNL